MAFPSSNNKKERNNSNWTSLSLSPAIMESVDSLTLINNKNYYIKDVPKRKQLPTMPDITLTSEFTSLMLGSADSNDNIIKGFQLIDDKERLKLTTAEEFCSLLGCVPTDTSDSLPLVKVISIVGDTGDGKSHTLNHTFFRGDEVFQTSSEQSSCTMGVWAAYDPTLQVICLDTEGLMGSASMIDAKHRTRLLVKVFGISDIVIYRTRSDRLHDNMFAFLAMASKTYANHLHSCLENICQKNGLNGSVSSLGPAILIFHETRHTKPLTTAGVFSPEDLLRRNFQEMGLNIDAFSSLTYLGQQTVDVTTAYAELWKSLKQELANTSVRSRRSPIIVFNTLKALNDRFSGKIISREEIIPDEYFTCPCVCLSCSERCQLSMGHFQSDSHHQSRVKCRYQHQYENIFYICKTCYKNGKEVKVIPKYSSSNDGSWFDVIAKYAWSGYVIECPNCGEIYRSRQYWYGNIPPEDTAVRTEIHHVWPGMSCSLTSSQISAQRVLDGVAYFTEAVVSASATPTKALGSWVTDQVAPKYWKSNIDIKKCHVCCRDFSSEMKKHHCRMCGEGVCSDCSSHSKPVPDKGWDYPVRVCDRCFKPPLEPSVQSSQVDENEVMPRKMSEAVVSTLSTVASILSYPKAVIKETARPTYWVPDSEARECCICSAIFSTRGGKAKLHHCRSCGGAVCGGCSTGRKPVPHRGWELSVRVCDACYTC